jgi:hypothetical protein
VRALILESDLQSARGREQAGCASLLRRLAEATEMRSDELDIVLALLQRAGQKGLERVFRDALEAAARLMPEEAEDPDQQSSDKAE